EELFESCERKEERHDATLGFPLRTVAVSGEGVRRRVKGVVRHRFHGEMVGISLRYLPPLSCTPDHRVFATSGPDAAPTSKPARDLVVGDLLAVPKPKWTGEPQVVDSAALFSAVSAVHRVASRIGFETRSLILAATAQGQSSRAIGA